MNFRACESFRAGYPYRRSKVRKMQNLSQLDKLIKIQSTEIIQKRVLQRLGSERLTHLPYPITVMRRKLRSTHLLQQDMVASQVNFKTQGEPGTCHQKHSEGLRCAPKQETQATMQTMDYLWFCMIIFWSTPLRIGSYGSLTQSNPCNMMFACWWMALSDAIMGDGPPPPHLFFFWYYFFLQPTIITYPFCSWFNI